MSYCFNINFSGATDIGDRQHNQDIFCINNVLPNLNNEPNFSATGICNTIGTHIFAVCDGVSSLRDSHTVARRILSDFIDTVNNCATPTSPEAIKQIIDKIQVDILKELDSSGMQGSCTLTFLVINNDNYIIGNIGDSPAFHFDSNGNSDEFSTRHNLATFKLLKGETPNKDDSSVLIFSLGNNVYNYSPSSIIRPVIGKLEAGIKFLLCTDGITNYYSESDLADKITNYSNAEELVFGAANTAHSDNCSAIVVSVNN